MPVLNWIGKESVVNHDKEIPFRLLKKIKTHSVGDSENLIIEGDNLEALKALSPYYQNKIKCICIDPPYNTGNEHWVYNDNINSPKIKKWLGHVVGIDDLTRHDKWLCMMYTRLKLLRELLRDDGVIFITISDNAIRDSGELYNLKLILDEIFYEENFVANIIWQHSLQPKGYTDKFSVHHNHILCYRKTNLFQLQLLERTEENNINYSNPDNDPKGLWRSGDVRNSLYRKNLIFDVITPSGKVIKPPSKGWRWSRTTIQEKIQSGEIIFNKDETRMIRKIYLESVEGRAPETIWFGDEVGTTRIASQEIKDIFGEIAFETPKPVNLIKKIIKIATEKNDFILDSFAGSGTTGHAVLEVNKEDGGNRKFILIEMEDKICREITSKRIKKVIGGYSHDHVNVPGLGGGFQYCTLSKPLFDEYGKIDEDCSFEDLATYIYFTETKTILDKNKISKNFIGEYFETHYYLIFRGIGKNTLTTSFLTGLNKDSENVIYADNCTISEDELEKYNTVFKQIPYEVRIF